MKRARRSLLLVLGMTLLVGSIAPAEEETGSLRFDRIAVGALLPMLAEQYGVQLTVAGEVPGVVSVDLKNRTLPSVLEEILFGTGYTFLATDEMLRVLPAGTTLARTYRLEVLDAVLFAEEVTPLIEDGQVSANAAANSVTLVASAADIRHIEEVLRETDVPPRQVEINARMIEVNHLDTKSLGIDWLFQWQDDIQSVDAAGNVNETTSPNLTIGFSRITDFQADAVLEAILSNTDSKIVSSPHLTTASNRTSKILVGERVPYARYTTETTTGSVQQEIEFVDVGVQLEVTPIVSGDSLVVMDVKAEISEVLDKEVQGIPRIGTREAHTRVVLAHGETGVIGGLRKDQIQERVDGIPFLSRIPVLGRLFRHESTEKSQSEILVFLTPKVVDTRPPLLPLSGHLIREEDLAPAAGLSP